MEAASFAASPLLVPGGSGSWGRLLFLRRSLAVVPQSRKPPGTGQPGGAKLAQRGKRGRKEPGGGGPGAFSPQPSSPSAHRSLCQRGKAGGGGSCFQLVHKCIDKELSESSVCTEGSFLAFFAPVFVPPRG